MEKLMKIIWMFNLIIWAVGVIRHPTNPAYWYAVLTTINILLLMKAKEA